MKMQSGDLSNDPTANPFDLINKITANEKREGETQEIASEHNRKQEKTPNNDEQTMIQKDH